MQQNGKEIFKYNESVVFILKIVLGKSLFVTEKIPFEKNCLGKGFNIYFRAFILITDLALSHPKE